MTTADKSVFGLLAAARDDFAASAVVPGLLDRETVTRMTLAADAQRAVDVLAPLADPYRHGRQSMTVDLVRAAYTGTAPEVIAAARSRLDSHHSARAIATETTANVPGLLPYPVAPVNGGGLAVSPLLDRIAVPVPKRPGSRGLLVPDGWAVGEAQLDPPEGAPDLPAADALVVDGETVPWHSAAKIVDVSRQVIDWADVAPIELDQAFSASVNITLENGIVSDIIAAATPMPAGATLAETLDAAEGVAGSVWPDGSPIIELVNPEDMPRVRRAYAGQTGTPLLVPTVGQPAGTITTFARNSVALYASALDSASATRPGQFMIGTYWVRYALAKVRRVPGQTEPETPSPAVVVATLDPVGP